MEFEDFDVLKSQNKMLDLKQVNDSMEFEDFWDIDVLNKMLDQIN